MTTYFYALLATWFTIAISTGSFAQAPDLSGWQRFGDPTLDSLIATGLRENADLKVAVNRLQEARLRTQLAETFLKPSVLLTPNLSTQSLTPNRPFQLATVSDAQRQRFQFNTFSVPFTASYELDLFNRIRQTIRVNDFQAQATEADYQSVRLLVAAEIARIYALVRTNDAEQTVFRRTILARDSTVAIIRERARVGLISQIDVQRAEIDVASLRVQVRTLERSRTELVNGLAQLLGLDPGAFTLSPGSLPTTLPQIPFATVPPDLVRRRPELQAADRLTQAADANVNIARALRKPRIALAGSAGFLSGQIGPLFLPSSATYLLGINASVPVFEGGRNQKNVVLADQQVQTAQSAYQQRFQVAQREAEVALDNYTLLRQQVSEQAQVLELARRTQYYNRELYVRGLTTYLDVLDAQRTVLTTEQMLVQLQGQVVVQAVALLRALGGDL
ncbi:MAG: efflux transporter outer membrane subunit [Bacteroidetes bacterium]|nr:efflux transporter outer membrane subunit [Fibrella sp.]